MSWNNVIPASLLSVDINPRSELENPSITIPDELVTDCRLAYSWEGKPGLISASEDHPAFARVRKILASEEYIEIPPYTCWNGDRVLKRFRFNGFQLEPGDKFYSAGAWAVRIKIRKDKGNE